MGKENAREVTLKATLDLSGFLKDVDALNKAYASIKVDAEQCAKATGAAFAGTERSSDKAFRDMGKDLDDTGLKIKAWGKDTTKAAKDAKKAFDSLKDAGPGGFGAGGDPYAGAVGEMEAEELQMREQYGDQHYELSQKQQSRMDKQKEKEIESEKNFGLRLVDEMERMGVLRGGLMWRGARAAGGTAVAVMAAGMIATKVFQGINKAIESTIETMEDLEKTSGAERAFTNLSRTAGISFDSIVSDTRKASGYTIEAYDIFTRANKELRDGFGGIAENMPQLAGLARTMGDAFGVDAAGMLDNLTGAIREADAATLESEFGFRGVSAALREAAADIGVTVENLDEVTASNIALQVVLPQTEQMMRNLGATSSTATSDMKQSWKELLGFMSTQRDVMVAEGVLLFGGKPGDIAAASDLSEQILQFSARMKELRGQTDEGAVSAESFARAWERVEEIFGPGGIEEMMLSGRVPLGIDADAIRSLRDEIEDIAAGIEPLTFDPLRIVTPVAFLKEFDAEMEKARDEVAKLEHEWTVAFAEFMPIEDARQSAGYLAQVYMDKMADAIRNTGSFASDEAEATTNKVLGILAQFLDTAEAWSTETMSRIGSEMIGAAYKAYTDLVGDQTKEAERIALGLSPYLSLGDVEQFSGATEKLLADWAELWSIAPDSLQAQYARRNILKDAQDIADAIRDANKETKASTGSMKDFASASLLANQNLGEWAAAFTMEHGGRDPMQAYARHEEPLVAAMVDKLWGEDFAKEKGRPPSDADWQAHWYEQWAPLEAWKGGPVGADTGPAGERAKAILKALGIEDLGDIYKKDWDKRHGLIAEMDTEMTKIQELNTALGGLAGYINSIIPPTEPPPPPPGYTLPAIPQLGAPPPAPYFAVPGMQHGGITRAGGLFNLHAKEVVMPLNRLTDMVNMRMGARGGGGLNIGALNIPVTVAGGGAGVATNVQQAVVGAIRGRGGTELMRAARRLGH